MDPDRHIGDYKIPSHCQTPQKEGDLSCFLPKLLRLFEFRSIFVDVTNKEIIQAQISQTSFARLVFFNTTVTISLKNVQNIWNQHDFFPSSIKLIWCSTVTRDFLQYLLHFYHLQIIRFLHISNTVCKWNFHPVCLPFWINACFLLSGVYCI